ncbi:MAG: hypothetical protein K2J27_03365 [Duncaniella sp.]|nr:hypothetical protein [Duncaniella sp.]
MKKKFISGLLLMALTAGGFSTFTSCKDTEEDLYNELRSETDKTNAELNKLNLDLLNKIKEAADSAKNDAIAEAGRLDGILRGEIPTDDEITGLANSAITAWAAKNGLNDLSKSVEDIINQLIADGKLNIGGGSDCSCALKDLKPEDAQALLALAGQAKALLGDNLDGKGGVLADVTTLKTNFKTLDEVINGKDGKGGLVGQVEGLEAWFENINLTPTQFQEYVKQGQFVKNNNAALTELVRLQNEGTLKEEALKELNKYATDLEGIDQMYNAIFKDAQLPEGETAWWNYSTVMQNIKNNSAAIEALQKDVDSILGRINDMVTSLVLQAATNMVYPSFNTPFGINSLVLMAYYGDAATQVAAFPVQNPDDMGAECRNAYDIDWAALGVQAENLPAGPIAHVNKDGKAILGELWFTANPGTVNNIDKNGFALVNSREESYVTLTDVYKDDDTLLKFGMNSVSRAAGNGNGLYCGQAVVATEDLDNIKVNIEEGLAEAVKDAVKNRKAADMLHLLKEIYNQVQNICDANALRYTYETLSGKGTATMTNKVYSNYGLAATAFKPLSFSTLQGQSFRHLPDIKPIEIDKSLVDLNLDSLKIGEVSLNVKLDLGEITFKDNGDLNIEVYVPVYDAQGNITRYERAEITGVDDLNNLVNDIKDSISEYFNGKDGDPSLAEKLQTQIKEAVDNAFNGPDGLIANIENQVNGMMGNIQDKLDDLVGQINNDYLGKVNKLIDKYNSVADRINKVLDNPNHYLQTVMLYGKANGSLGVISTNSHQATQFKGNGEAIELYATTFNFETVCPVYKKVVAVTKVTDENGAERKDLRNAANASLAKVVNGDWTRFALDVKGAKNGVFTYEIAYQALDYSGFTSTVKTYIQVVRK